jgi:hypothetical protein
MLFVTLIILTQMVKHAPPQQLLRETPIYYVTLSSGFLIYDKDVLGGARFNQLRSY